MELAALVLAGGRGRRMGGGKPFRSLAGRPLLLHAAERVAAPGRPLAVSTGGAAPGPFAAQLPAAALLPDPPGTAGPAAGLLAGLSWAAGLSPRPDALLVVPADAPFLPDDLGERLAAAAAGVSAVVATSASGPSPVVGLYRLEVRDTLAAVLDGTPAPAMAALLGRLPHRTVAIAAPPALAARGADPLFNVNRPQELAAAEALLAGRADQPPRVSPATQPPNASVESPSGRATKAGTS